MPVGNLGIWPVIAETKERGEQKEGGWSITEEKRDFLNMRTI